MYKVEFIGNKAKSATPIPFGLYSDLKEFGQEGKKTIIKWYIVEAENEKDALELADTVVKKIWGTFLGLR